MDVGYFISVLLGQHGKVSVPGLGLFAHTRVNGYYNQPEGKFYPPGYHVQFTAQAVNDNTLSQYIAANKNISFASAQYFTEKYIINLRQKAETEEVALSDLGWFYTDQSELKFKPNNNLGTDPEFFGYPTITLPKLNAQPTEAAPVLLPAEETPAPAIAEQPAAVTEEPVAVAPVITPTPAETVINTGINAPIIDEPKKTPVWLYIIPALVVVAAIAYFVIQQNVSTQKINKPAPVVKAPVKPAIVDTAQTTPADTIEPAPQVVTKDTITAKPVATAPKESIVGPHYEILGGAFSNVTEANKAISNYKKMGFEARILDNVHGKKRKVTLGSYPTRAQAVEAQKKILSTGKIRPSGMYIQPYNVK
jgi:cell division protein FtsN